MHLRSIPPCWRRPHLWYKIKIFVRVHLALEILLQSECGSLCLAAGAGSCDGFSLGASDGACSLVSLEAGAAAGDGGEEVVYAIPAAAAAAAAAAATTTTSTTTTTTTTTAAAAAVVSLGCGDAPKTAASGREYFNQA